MRAVALSLLVAYGLFAPLRPAYATDKESHYLTIFSGRSQLILGSEDPRHGAGIGLGIGHEEPRLRFRSLKGELVYEGYYAHSSSPGASGNGPNQTDSIGALAYARYQWPKRHGTGLYVTFGWGLQLASQPTVDLDSNLNSTPMIGAGVSISGGDTELSLGIRFMHVSNAGLVGRNQGQNQLFVILGFRY